MDGRTDGWTVTVRRDAPIVIQIAAAYKRRQKFSVKRDACRNETERSISLVSTTSREALFPFNSRVRRRGEGEFGGIF